MKPQILYIHGGMTFKTREHYINYLKTRSIRIENLPHWNEEYMNDELNEYQIIKPKMPCKENSKYLEWKIHFERHTEFIEDGVTLIGFSLGGIFLAKYLSENLYPKKIKSVHLVAPPHEDSLTGEDLTEDWLLQNDLGKIEEQCKNVYLYFSLDDPIIPESQKNKYQEKLKKSTFMIYESANGHFLQPEFEDLISNIKKHK